MKSIVIYIVFLLLPAAIFLSFSFKENERGSTFPYSNHSKDTSIFIQTDKTVYGKADTIVVTANGFLWCTGLCWGEGNELHMGLLHKKRTHWDTIINLRQTCNSQSDCGPSTFQFENFAFILDRNYISYETVSLEKGTYKLSVMDGNCTEITYSNEFTLE